MQITKLAQNRNHFRRPFAAFDSARAAFRAWLRGVDFGPGETVLLPAFIGWSAREGSGVFDPVAELGLPYRFYRLDGCLAIDLEHLRLLLAAGGVRALVIIHYFGYVDPGYREAVALARAYGVSVLEDEAHALYTDLVGGISGRLGDAAIFSLHKMLPVERGGLLAYNRPDNGLPGDLAEVDADVVLPWEYDLFSIARQRIANAECLSELLAPHGDLVVPLRPALRPGEVPQTYPVFILRGSRDLLYQRMNDAGVGVVTLYHTLIDRISRDEFPEAHAVAGKILNLPLHQDADRDQMAHSVRTLVDGIRSLPPR